MEEQNPTPQADEAGGASTLDRLERFLAPSAPDQTNQDESQDAPDAGADQDVTPDGDGPQSSEPQLTTSDLAKFLGVDETALDLDEDGTVKLKTKVDGIEGAAKLQDLLKSYQLQEHVDKRTREAAEREKALQARTQEAEQQFAQRLQQAEALTQVALNQIHAEFRSIDWNALSAQDPGRAALMRQQFIERDSQLRGVLQNIEHEKSQSKVKEETEEKTRYSREIDRIPQAIPEWIKDGQLNETYLKESGEIQALATKRGVSPEVLKAITQGRQFDAGLLSIIRDGLLYQKMQQSKPEIENRVRKAPVLVKPGQPAQSSQVQTLQNLKQAVRKSGGKQGTVADWLIAAGKV